MAWLKEDLVESIQSSYPHIALENKTLENSTAYSIVDIWFLDSFDVDWDSPDASAFHGFCEMVALVNPEFNVDHKIDIESALDQAVRNIKVENIMLRPGAYIWIDDTPKNEKVWERVQGGHWHSMHPGTLGKPLSYLNHTAAINHMKLSHGIFPGKGSFAMDRILGALPKKFKKVYHEYSVVYKVL